MAEKHWIQSAIKHPGALHKKLHVPEGEPIPASRLKPKLSDSPKTRKQKILAMTLRRMHH